MRNKVAKLLRRTVYGDFSLRGRKYFIDYKKGMVVADDKRRDYQKMKKDWKIRKEELK